ncbi:MULTISPECIES: AAA family ATPase [unclassified Lebetimonas]|uniref:AAA family ATPase n=1 Tax=unclassified Lebetimonas TaxID=2648158 RepID=UPI0004652080|nr:MULTISPECIES: AAA family ATPase [unclassified Lebetimonas]
MITKIKLHKTASYADVVEIEPKAINYFFGSNGTGKSSLGKVIADISTYPHCNLEWATSPIDVFIYNKQFVQDSFSQSNAIKGIFTLGKDATGIQKFIEEANAKIGDFKNKIEGLNKSIETQEEKLSKKRDDVEEKAWALKKKYEAYFKPAFKGFMGSAKDFFNKCISEQKNSSDLLDEKEIIEKSKKVFNDDLKAYDPIDEFTFDDLSKYENSEILKTKIVGKEDIEIGKLIHKLDNSDWVKDGVNYLQQTENICPFCQQSISKDLREQIESFFDETYENKKKELADFIQNYKSYVNGLLTKLQSLIGRDIPILDFKELKAKIELLKNTYKNNLSELEKKLKTPSIPIGIDSLEPILSEISELIKVLKKEVEDNNSTFENIKTEKTLLKSKIWRFIVNELDIDLKSYNKIKSDVEKAIKGRNDTLKLTKEEKGKLETKVAKKESEVTSVKPTVNEINKILKLFGFTNFMLEEADEKGFYKVVRENGSEVNGTLSEGESTFLTFLYFYHMLRGSTNDTGVGKDKIVVIDDPISSLDSNVLFIVSNLTKELLRDVKNGTNGIKQIFILTHNVYFFKEVTFKGGGNNKWKEEAYWIVRKLNNKTQIIEHEKNPIKTTYELLWRELDDIEKINTATIFNTLRRILEYYFNILGGLDYEDAISKFEGEKQIICKSLISWVNDGSHFINDDLVVDAEPENVEKYLKVFELIFEKMGHKSHYEMMMNNNVKKE